MKLGIIKNFIKRIRAKSYIKTRESGVMEGFKFSSVKSGRVKRFIASSETFIAAHKKEVSLAVRIINRNMKKLKLGASVEEKGFVIKPKYTGKMYPGRNASLTLSVSLGDRVCFVKLGAHCGENNFVGYLRAKDYFAKNENQLYGYRVEVVPSHLFYSKSTFKGNSKGFSISDFFPSDKVALVNDIERSMGEKAFSKTELGRAVCRIGDDLYADYKVEDGSTINCFLDRKTKTLYFFDLYATTNSL